MPRRGELLFQKGPMFTQLLLADEVNRASPKTQSALLEAMEERQVSVDVTTYRLPDPFFVVATQNPFEQLGTFRLPESQLDRFLMRISLGYPDAAHERALLAEGDRRDLLAGMTPALNPDGVRELQAAAQRVHVAPALLEYVQTLLASTRRRSDIQIGLVAARRPGPGARGARAGRCSRAATWCCPEDVQAVFAPVASHRLESAGVATRCRSRGVHRRDSARRAGARLESADVCDGASGDGQPEACACADASRPGRDGARARTGCPSPSARAASTSCRPAAALAFAALLLVMLLAGLNYSNSVAHADHLPARRASA